MCFGEREREREREKERERERVTILERKRSIGCAVWVSEREEMSARCVFENASNRPFISATHSLSEARVFAIFKTLFFSLIRFPHARTRSLTKFSQKINSRQFNLLRL